MRVVVDSSVAVKLVVPENGQAAAFELLRAASERLAPKFLLVEVGNTLWKKIERGELSAVQAPTGLQIAEDAITRFVDDSELIVLSGSLPRGFSSTTYAELAAHVRDAGKRCLIDAGGELLQHAAQTRPFLVKPNRDEIAELLGRPIGDLAAAVDAVRELHAGGIAMPVVTMGALGAVAADASGVWHASIELEQVRNTVGSGDCVLAGMTVGMARNMNLEGILRLGVACGSANAQGQETGFVERRAVETLLAKVRVQRLA